MKDVSAVVGWLLEGGGKDSEMSSRLAARMGEWSGFFGTDEETLDFLAEASGDGDRDAQCMMGLAFEHGLGVRPSLIEAIRWYGLAADAGDGFAMERAGNLCQTLGIVGDGFYDGMDLYALGAEYGNAFCL
ncbi:MAG: sel1 repeat family protein [Candidatus Methanomethylophilaceae archaeon]|nr:sel1 repeat family protein [Candidatus Methanomethylophilaceae archaeon]